MTSEVEREYASRDIDGIKVVVTRAECLNTAKDRGTDCNLGNLPM